MKTIKPVLLVSLLFAVASCSFPQIVASKSSRTLRQRYDSTICAIALIKTDKGSGTGFFVDEQGDMVTAAHVVSSKDFFLFRNQISFSLKFDKDITVTPHGRPPTPLELSDSDADHGEYENDLAFIHTGIKPPCWIPFDRGAEAHTGDHLISIGFPGIDNGNPILYEGFLSGTFKHPPTSVVGTLNGRPLIPQYNVMKVQMPITPGASGSPIIDDEGRAIAVVSEAPIVWTQDLEGVTKVAQTGSGITLSGYDAVKILGELAVVVREFESPGSGYAVPLSYLNRKRNSNPTPSTGAH